MRLFLFLAILIACLYLVNPAPVVRTCGREDIETCKELIPPITDVPKCNSTKGEAEKCFDALAERCPDDLEIEHYLEKFKLIQKAMCKPVKTGGTGAKFEKNQKCWAKTDECLTKLVTPHRLLAGKVCDAKKADNDQCKVLEEVFWDCKEIHAIFLEHAFQESQCSACNLKFNILLFVFSFISLFYRFNF